MEGRRLVEGIDPNDPSKPLTTVQELLIRFNQEYKDAMDSPASAAVVAEWIDDPSGWRGGAYSDGSGSGGSGSRGSISSRIAAW